MPANPPVAATGGEGAGLYDAGTATLTNVTVAGNTAQTTNGASKGGGIQVAEGSLTLQLSTIARNAASSGANLSNVGGSTLLTGTLLADPSGGGMNA